MEGNSNWRSHHEPNLRNNSISNLIIWLRNLFRYDGINQTEEKALKIEENIYCIAIDKDDYNRKISERILMMQREARNLHFGSSVNETNYTLEPVQVLNQGRQELLSHQQQQEANQQLQMSTSHETNEMNDVSMRQTPPCETTEEHPPLQTEDIDMIEEESEEITNSREDNTIKDSRRRSLTIDEEEPNQSKRMKLSITSQTEADSTASPGGL